MTRSKREKFEVIVYSKSGEAFTRTVSARNNVEAVSRAMPFIPLDVVTVKIVVNGETLFPNDDLNGRNGKRGRPYAFKSNTSYNVGMTTARFVRHYVQGDKGDFVDAAIREKMKREMGIEW